MKVSVDAREAYRDYQSARAHLDRMGREHRINSPQYQDAQQRVRDTANRLSCFE